MEQKSCKRPWRKLVKKLQRKRKRQKLARQRNDEFHAAELEKLKDPLYKSWLQQQEAIERQKQLADENQRLEQEELWLRKELLAQKQFKIDEVKRQAEERKLEAERLKEEQKLKILEEARQKKRDEIQLQTEKAAKEFDNIMINMQEYLEDCTMKTPTRLDCSLYSRPGEKSCDFFDKTNCCRFGPGCTFNHKRPMLSKIIIIKHFFQHPLLEQQDHKEYSRSDSELELSERDLRDSYDEFCKDVWPVLEEFGSIINFRTVRNVQAHLRGHVFVEYADKRSALKAFINLQNRYYATKRLNVEFSNMQQWRRGVCGLSLGRKCPKGFECNFLHLMKNIDDKYNQPVDNPERFSRSVSNSTRLWQESPVMSWNSDDKLNHKSLHSRNWRWSESPEIDLKPKNKADIFKNKNATEDKSSTDSSLRKSRNRSRSSSPNSSCYQSAISSRSKNSSNFICEQNSINSTLKSPSSRHRKSKKKSSALEKPEHSSNKKKSHKSKERKKSKSKRRKNPNRRSSSPTCQHHKDSKRRKTKSPLSDEKGES